jgi:dipeptidyl aminopeptidase/acylaminoacyl peptidase
MIRSSLLPARGLAAALALAATAALSARELIPLETFFGADAIASMALSPDGNKIAMIAPNGGRYSIALLDTTTGKASVLVAYEKENIASVSWKGNDRLLFRVYSQGHEIPLVASTDLAAKSIKRLVEPRVRRDDDSIFSGNLVDTTPWDPNHILIYGLTAESDDRRFGEGSKQQFNPTPAIYRVNVRTGKRSQVVSLDNDVDSGEFDRELQQRLTSEVIGNEIVFQYRARNDEPWQKLRQFDIRDVRWNIAGMRADGKEAYIIDTTEHEHGILRAFNLDAGRFTDVVFAPQEGRILSLIFSPKRERLIGVRHEVVKHATHWVDPRWKTISASLERGFPEHVVSILSIADDEKRFLFAIYSDRDPGRFFLGDLRGEGMRVQPINAVRPGIKPELMSPVEPIKYAARDGLEIHGYLTKPGGRADRQTPLLVMPHGGPFGIRDSWGFDPEVQFLANRGYAVLQVNYRGSGGYGASFERAGYQEWGGKMQDDLTDAVQWVIAQGWCDPQRVGIIGASYGGYAALAGVTMTPELYRVGINYVGVSDLRLITRWDLGKTAASKAVFELRIGRDPKFLAERSPVNHVANIRVPTLHAYGLNDPRVEISHWEALEAALKKHGKVYESYVETEEGHGFGKAENSIRYYRAVEAFLARHMPADGPAVGTGPAKVTEKPAKTGE